MMGAFDILSQIKDMGNVNEDVSTLRDAMSQRIQQLQSAKQSPADAAAPWLAAMAGFSKPTKTGSFFEALGPVGENVGAALQKQSEKEQATQDKLLQLQQARVNLGMDMIQKQANIAKIFHDLQQSQAEGKMPQTKDITLPDGTRATMQWDGENKKWVPFTGIEGYTPQSKPPEVKSITTPSGTRSAIWDPEQKKFIPVPGMEDTTAPEKPPEIKTITTPSGGSQSVVWDPNQRKYVPVPGSESLPGKTENPKEPVVREFTLGDGTRVTLEWNPETKQWTSPSGVSQTTKPVSTKEPVVKEFTLEDGSKVTREWNPSTQQWISPSGITQPKPESTGIKPVDPAKLKELGLPPTGPDTEQFVSGITDPKERARALQEDQKVSQKVVTDFNAAAKAAENKNEATKNFMRVAEENQGRQGPIVGATSRLTSAGQQMQKFANESTSIGLKDAFGSRVTNMDLQFAERANVSPMNSFETNKQIATARDATTDRIKDQASFYRNWYATHRTTRGADDAWAQYMKDNPIFDPKGNPDNPASIKKNPNAVSWKEYFRKMHESPSTDEGGWSDIGGVKIKKVQ